MQINNQKMNFRKINFILFFSILFLFGFLKKSSPKLPNILWITCEDMSPHLGCYGDTLVKTLNLDKLAAEGTKYTNAFATAGVCAPSRSTIITGCYQTSIGTQHMRAPFNPAMPETFPPSYVGYSAVLPVGVKCFSEYLRQDGYYCTNNEKQDYQFSPPVTAWNQSNSKAHWRNRKNKNQPFFSVFNLFITHESQIWGRAKEPLLINPKDVSVPSYYPDNEIIRTDIARNLTNIMKMDMQVGELIQQLKDDWMVYQKPIKWQKGDSIYVVNQRIGYEASKIYAQNLIK